MSLSTHADVVVIGAGSAGLTALRELRQQGLSALLIDHGPLGTTCARVGCMPSKAALHAGQQWATLSALSEEERTTGLAKTPLDLWRHAQATRDLLAGNTAKRTRSFASDKLIMGRARFTGPNTLDVDGRTIHARAFIVATGSQPIMPKSLAPLGERVHTTDSLFDLEALPESIGILGLGAIGLEMGLALSRLGVRVVAGDLQDVPAGIADPDIAARAIEHFSQEITMWLGQAMEATPADQGIELRSGDRTDRVDLVLAALGRRPNTDGLDLKLANVPHDAHDRPLIHTRTLRAGSSSVFFAGDVSNLRPLMHEAVDEGVIAARAAAQSLDNRDQALPSRRTPLAIVFSDPDIATVGQSYDALNLDQTVIGTAQGDSNGRSRVLGAEDNLVKVYADRDDGRLLGASLIATRGEHLAHLLAWAIQRGETVDDLLALPYYHPSIEEMLQTALKDASQQLRTGHR